MSERDAFEVRFGAAVRGYVGRVSSDLDPVELAHRIAAREPRRHGFAASLTWRGVAIPRVAWVLLLAALLAALAGTALVASRLLETAPRVPPLGAALVPTRIDVLTPETGGYAGVVADGDGILWAREPGGRLVRFDPASGSAQAWTIGDDAGFGVTWSSGFDIVPAREGGVWLVGLRTLRWFDGEVFREVIEAPVEIAHAAGAPDGSLWVATGEGVVLHWDGSSWSRLDGGRPNPDAYVSAIAVDAAGRPWIGGITQVVMPPDAGGGIAESGWVSRHDGSTWTTFDARDAAPLEGPVWSIAQLPDGAVWVATAGRGTPVLGEPPPGPVGGLARFDGASWTDATAQLSGARNTTSVAAGPDGTIWVADGDGNDGNDGAVTVGRFDGRSWTSYGPADGLPGPNESAYVVAWALPTKDGVYVGTGAGIYRLSGDRWERAWPKASSPMSLSPMNPGHLLAVSRDELWAAGNEGLWHFERGAWTSEPIDPRHPEGVVRALTLAPDGTPWAAGSDGVAYRRDGRWTIAGAAEASVITVGRDGTVWVGGGSDDLCRVWTLRFDGTAWASRAVAGCPPESFGLSSLAIDATGALWADTAPGCALGMSGCTQGGLARLDGQSWEAIGELGGSTVTNATIVGTTRTGDMWVVDDPTESRDPARRKNPVRAARFDGMDWTVVELPEGSMADIVVAPDGTLWAWAYWTPASTGSGDRGPARYDGTAWTFPYDGAGLPWMELAAVAPDGTVFGRIDRIDPSIFRFPDQAPPP